MTNMVIMHCVQVLFPYKYKVNIQHICTKIQGLSVTRHENEVRPVQVATQLN